MLLKTQGLVLKQRNIGENDRILVLLTKDYGIMEVSARGVKRMKSPLAGGCQLLSYSEFCIFQGKKYDTVNSAEVIHSFYNIRLDVAKLSLATYFCDLTNYLSPQKDSSWVSLRFLLNTLALLEDDKREMELLKCIFELKMLSFSGFMPNLVCCADCQAYETDPMYFLPIEAKLICADCIEKYKNSGLLKYTLTPPVLYAMRHIIYAEDAKLFQFNLKGDSLKQLEFITENYVLIQTEQRFKALDVYRQTKD
ncbi:Recombination protein O [uncultured Ruminococcus sp.]|uniref:DNA repair protein RecO n=1 Tax=Massiliimalia timonensis TaxID=1987501 RepID=A0A8J6P017_9FIRM|nr:DNA repair protein RecO [Massiliimalia timonensis]MBC8610174.1 DNA repair protein RecO [Massiliimalia timonensis]SCH06203.1 Recombination protein O [uncultured Ruminococcus sp.]SCH75743.1 Recombination protein O [uncultured Clostridium sp.]